MNTTPQTTEQPLAVNGSSNINAFSSEEAFKTAQRMAHALSKSTLVPVAYQNNLPNVLIAMELAARIGSSPFAVMQNLDIIHGRPSWRATFLIATVNACGRFSPLRFRFTGDEGTPSWGCRARATDRSTDEECVGSLITIKLVIAEGWMSRKGSKWKTMPEQMLMYRAAAFWARVYAPELSLGMHTRGELDDGAGSNAPSVRQVSSLGERLSAAAEPDVTPEPADDPSPTDHDPETGEVHESEASGPDSTEADSSGSA